MTSLYFSWKLKKSPRRCIIHYSRIFTLFTLFTILIKKNVINIPLSWCNTYFLCILFFHYFVLQTFRISVSFVFIYLFFLLHTLCGIYFFCILFLLQTNQHIFLLLVYLIYLYYFSSIFLLYLALIFCFFDSRLNRRHLPLLYLPLLSFAIIISWKKFFNASIFYGILENSFKK